jgi:hypothetical protein
MKRTRLLPLLWLCLSAFLLCGAGWALQPAAWRPHTQTELLAHTVYAYRQWQSTGIKVNAGDRFTITARGEWVYSPEVGLTGPEGGLPAPSYYPLPYARGGALIGRVGESGEPFYVGGRATGYANEAGLLYLRINDDLLGDNEGRLRLEIKIAPAP